MEAIRTEKLTKYYGKSRGIVDLDLSVQQGEFFGFIGPNGAGKSTAIRTLLGLISPTSGEAHILGRSIQTDQLEILRAIGYLPSESAFYSGMRVRDILKLSAQLRGVDCDAEANSLCERLQLDTDRKISELSFGNKKKASIVCALQHNPSLLILDEPTGGLDPLMQKEFFDILRERNEKGVTVFLSSHILSEVGRHCTRAAIIREGTIVACDSVSALSKTNAKRVTVKGFVDLTPLEGVRDVQRTEHSVSFLFGGALQPLLSLLSSSQIEDLTVTEPDLEEIFLHYYVKGGDSHDHTEA